eukprot:TRINITY_DN72505_c0_g1_i1.p1 TRINITY_DN72505_c0_g1~~TRINITY_DN72505_c0_g1_i1.p1  ORF type:complete len:617 (-),score=75.03 TRINITY_DN72505_c0_g1_i1:96-1889(-)
MAQEHGSSSATCVESCSSRIGTRASVQVVVRVRPRLASEATEADGVSVIGDGKTLLLTDGKHQKQFTLDHVFDCRRSQTLSAEDLQAACFESFGRSLAASSLEGYDVCLFAYGHTGTGKTYTMMGDARGKTSGLIPRFLHAIFDEHIYDPSSWRCSCEYFEVYNDKIRDLLCSSQAQSSCKMHIHPKRGVYIDDLTKSGVSCVAEVLDILTLGNKNRTVRATALNMNSSRSHAFFTFRYARHVPEKGESPGNMRQSSVTFVDLAGRENSECLTSQNKGTQYREMCCINSSLFHLAHLIKKISLHQVEQGSLVDFRNCKVTMLLSQALAGNSRTGVMTTVSPIQSAYEDSVSTMNFATSIQHSVYTKPRRNVRLSSSCAASTSELEAQVCRLQQELQECKRLNVESERKLCSAQSLASYYRRSWEETVRLSASQHAAQRTLDPTHAQRTAQHDHSLDTGGVEFLMRLKEASTAHHYLNKSSSTCSLDSQLSPLETLADTDTQLGQSADACNRDLRIGGQYAGGQVLSPFPLEGNELGETERGYNGWFRTGIGDLTPSALGDHSAAPRPARLLATDENLQESLTPAIVHMLFRRHVTDI